MYLPEELVRLNQHRQLAVMHHVPGDNASEDDDKSNDDKHENLGRGRERSDRDNRSPD